MNILKESFRRNESCTIVFVYFLFVIPKMIISSSSSYFKNKCMIDKLKPWGNQLNAHRISLDRSKKNSTKIKISLSRVCLRLKLPFSNYTQLKRTARQIILHCNAFRFHWYFRLLRVFAFMFRILNDLLFLHKAKLCRFLGGLLFWEGKTIVCFV